MVVWLCFQISGDDPDEYKRSLKSQLRKALDRDKDLLGGAPEFVIAYVQPSGLDMHSKGPKKVMDLETLLLIAQEKYTDLS